MPDAPVPITSASHSKFRSSIALLHQPMDRRIGDILDIVKCISYYLCVSHGQTDLSMSVKTLVAILQPSPVSPGARMEEKERRGIQSFEIGTQLLVELARHVAPMALKDLAKAAGMSTGKAHMRTHALRRTLGADAAGKTKKAPADRSPARKKERVVD